MERFVKGDVVVLPFPFSDLTKSKKRPALVIGKIEGDDIILSQITTKERIDRYSIKLSNNDFITGKLIASSIIKPQRIFSADKSIIIYKIGSINKNKVKEVENTLISIFSS